MIILNSGKLLKSAVTKSLEEIQCKSKKVERKYSVVGVKVICQGGDKRNRRKIYME